MDTGEIKMMLGVEMFLPEKISDQRGQIFHYMKKSFTPFRNFDIQEVYFSTVYIGAIKAWHLHKYMTLNYAVPVGNIKLVVYDDRVGSPTRYEVSEFYLGENHRHQIIRIAPGIWNGFMSVGDKGSALVVNLTDMEHDPDEIVRADPFTEDIPYDWNAGLYG